MNPSWHSINGFMAARAEVVLVARERAALPSYLGSTLRGSLAHALRRISCAIRREECADCLLRERCAYSYLFETPFAASAPAVSGLANAPRPIVIEPPAERAKPWEAKEELRFGIVLIGRAIEHFPYLVAAAERMAEAGLGRDRFGFRLARVEARGAHGTKRVLWAADKPRSTIGAPTPIDWRASSDRARKAIGIRFVTPARIVEDGSLVENLSFRDFARSLLFRVSALSALHCGRTVELDFKSLLRAAEETETVASDLRRRRITRWSNRQKAHIDLEGLEGTVAWRGDAVRDLWPFIKAGEVVHVGKATVFGLGEYKVVEAARRK